MLKTYIRTVVLFSLFTINAQADYWTQKANFAGAARQRATGFSIGTKGYLGTGYATAYMNDFWEYDQATNVWTQKSNLPGALRAFAAGFSIGTKGYIGSGYNGAYLGDLWEWDQATNVWTQKASLATALSHAVGLSIGNKGYIVTGFNGGPVTTLYEWNQVTNTWTQKASLPGNPRGGASGFTITNKIYITSGSNIGTYYNDLWEWDQSTNVWTQKTNYGGLPAYMPRGFAIGNWGYTGTGQDINGTTTADFWLYDPPSDTWIQKASYGGIPVHYSSAFSIGNKGYLGTGQTTTVTDAFWEYTPDSITTSVAELNLAGSSFFILSPNPAKDFVEIHTQETFIGIAEVILTDVSGKKVYASPCNSQKLTINVAHFKPGVYFAEIHTAKKKFVKRFFKE